MRPEANYEKWMTMAKLTRGDKVKTMNGEVVEFQSLKQKNFVAKKTDGTLWNMSVNSFVELVEKATVVDNTSEINTLKLNELFYILHKEQVTVFRFEYVRGNKIHAKNPISGGKATMDIGLYGGKVSEL